MQEVNRRDDDFRATIFSFQNAHEDETYALCRWLRARKYNLTDTIQMVEEATECTTKPRKHNFYPITSEALHVEESLYIKQYPQLYYGHARNGCPVFISQPGLLNIDAVGSLTSVPSIINYHWNAQMHQYMRKLKEEYYSSRGSFKRYEHVCILDLKHLSPGSLSKKPLNIAKVQSSIDSLCFPETLNKMVIVNAPGFFTMTWKVIRGWIDQRTANKVEVIGSNQMKVFKKLSEIIDPTKMLSDYGGMGISVDDFLRKEMLETFEKKRKESGDFSLALAGETSHQISFKGTVKKMISLESGKIAKLSVFTRSLAGLKVIVRNSAKKILSSAHVQHNGTSEDTDELPTRFDFDDDAMLQGHDRFEVELVSLTTRFTSVSIMLVVKEFVVDESHAASNQQVSTTKQKTSMENPERPIVRCSSAQTRQQFPPKAVALSAESICTGTFPMNHTQNFYVMPSPSTMETLSSLRKVAPRPSLSDSCNGDFGEIPNVRRITSDAPSFALMKSPPQRIPN